MTSKLDDNTNENGIVDAGTKKRFSWRRSIKILDCVLFPFFLIGVLATFLVSNFLISQHMDQRYRDTGDHWGYEHVSKSSEELDIVRFSGKEVTDSELNELVGRRDVAAVYFTSCPNISDACIDSLRKIPNLRRLVFRSCDGLKEADFSKLAHLKKLKRLDLWSCDGLTDKSAETIARLRSLKILNMGGCSQLSVKSVAKLRSLPLAEFAPPECVLNDEAIAELTKFKRLLKLYLKGATGGSNGLTDDGVMTLASMRRLDLILVEDCQSISEEGLKKLEETVNEHRGMWQYELETYSKGVKENAYCSGTSFEDYCPKTLNVIPIR